MNRSLYALKKFPLILAPLFVFGCAEQEDTKPEQT